MIRSCSRSLVAVAVLVGGLGIQSARGVDFDSFLFSDSAGTELDFTSNTANPGTQWTVDTNNLFPAATNGSGLYVIRKEGNAAASAVLNTANVTTGVRYLSVDLAGWAFRGFDAAEPEELRFGFLDNDDGAFTGNLVTAQVQVRRNTTTQGVELIGDAVGPGSTNLARNVQLGVDQAAPFRLMLELNKSANTYEVFYKNGALPSQSLGIGNVAPTRNGNSVRLFVNNNFGSEVAEMISVDRLAVTDTNPLTDLLTLEVNRTSGELKLINTTGGSLAGLESYSILSPSGALNPTNWKKIAGNYDFAGDKSVDVDNTWAASVMNTGELTEAVTSGNGGALATNQQVVLSLGTGAWVKNPVEDLYMELRFAGGVTRSANVNFIGNTDKRFAVGDLNFDGTLTTADWTIFVANSETDLSGLTAPYRYQRGDLDADGTNGPFDFIAFKTAYDTANGLGAFEAMLATVPEPATGVLALGGVALAMMLRRGRRQRGGNVRYCGIACAAAVACIAMLSGGSANAGILQDFTFNDPNGTPIESAANSVSPTTVWLPPNNPLESAVQNGKFRINKQTLTTQASTALDIANVTTGKVWLVTEIAGWNYTGTASTPPERVRLGFLDNDPPTAGSSTITAEMNIDRVGAGLELNGAALGTGSGNVSATLALPLVRATPLTIVLELDKTLDQYSVHYKDNAGPFVPLGTANLGVSTLNSGDRDGNGVRFAVTGTFGEPGEFFDIDRMYLTDVSPFTTNTDALTLRVNRTNGLVELVNDSDTAFNIDLYRIESSANRLNTGGWNSLSDRSFGAVDGPDLGGGLGDGVGETWDEAGGSDAGVLSEMFLLGSSNFAANSPPVTLGNAFVPGGETPLTFQYRNATTGALLTGNVEFVTGGVVLDADFNNNNFVDGNDFLIWQRNLGTGNSNLTGDANGDGAVNGADLVVIRSQFGAAPPSVASAAAVAEPSSVAILAGLAVAIVTGGRGRRRG
jgi:hypothetical protein